MEFELGEPSSYLNIQDQVLTNTMLVLFVLKFLLCDFAEELRNAQKKAKLANMRRAFEQNLLDAAKNEKKTRKTEKKHVEIQSENKKEGKKQAAQEANKSLPIKVTVTTTTSICFNAKYNLHSWRRKKRTQFTTSQEIEEFKRNLDACKLHILSLNHQISLMEFELGEPSSYLNIQAQVLTNTLLVLFVLKFLLCIRGAAEKLVKGNTKNGKLGKPREQIPSKG